MISGGGEQAAVDWGSGSEAARFLALRAGGSDAIAQ